MFQNSVFKVSVDTKKWAKAAGVRAVKTMAQTAVALLPAAATITAVDWKTVAGTAALAGVVSLLTSVAGLPEEEAVDLEDSMLQDTEYNDVEDVEPEVEEEGEA